MAHDPYRALYLHLPFCVSRCAYCDFTTKATEQSSPEIDTYVEDLCLQIRKYAKEGELSEIETVYMGGGTPSHVGMSRLSMLLYTLSTSMHFTDEVECTMEANPESLTRAMVRDIWALGVNRLSLGVQSFDDEVLQLLGRAHSADDAKCAIDAAHERFENVSIDLMCGIPGQSLESFEASVSEAIAQGVGHVSIYPLTIEPHTPFYKQMLKGKLAQVDEDEQAQHMQAAASLLQNAGFERYEVASYAKPGYQCKHNLMYWSGVPYLGIGKSAATMTQNETRRMRIQDGCVTDDLNPAQMAAEDVMLMMRTSRGVAASQLAHYEKKLPQIIDTFDELERLGLLTRKGEYFCPTEQGWLCGNELYGRIYDLAP